MGRVILAKVKGWTPIIDVLAKELGLVTAAVFGQHWRFSQMEDGVCFASIEKIASRLGISSRTARRHTHKLVEAGFLEDLTPDRCNAPHVYRDTGKVKIEGLLEAGYDSELDQAEKVGLSVTPRYDSESEPGLTESQEKKPFKTPNQDMDGADGIEKETEKATLLIDFGVSATEARKLAQLCSLDQITGWISHATHSPGLHSPVGFVISKLRDGELPPSNGRQSETEERRRYLEWAGGR